jgi:hypothetical protein
MVTDTVSYNDKLWTTADLAGGNYTYRVHDDGRLQRLTGLSRWSDESHSKLIMLTAKRPAYTGKVIFLRFKEGRLQNASSSSN